ncbi:MAG: hypothetical protein ACRERD_07685 [Candidatus Binatia bacterium]
MGEDSTLLAQILTEELVRPAPGEALTLAAEIRRRHGAAVAAILFYGSCLRTQRTEGGVLDFYVLVDSYRAAYSSRALAWLNTLLPPNVFYLEVKRGAQTFRAKYAVVSTTDFAYAASPRSLHSSVWARFCQPTLLVYARDESARTAVIHAVVRAVLTMIARIVALLPASGDSVRFQPRDLWQHGFAETYRAELRPERVETIRGIYEADPGRYDRVAFAALHELEREGLLQMCGQGPQPSGEMTPQQLATGNWQLATDWGVTMTAQQRRQARLGWRLRRPLMKGLYVLRLVKSAATFGDWLPYVLWKLERHTGVRIEASERQRKHPILCGWPIILRFLWRRALR